MPAFSLLLVAALQQPAQAAPPRLPVGVGDTSPFRRLALPTPTLLREGSGAPGPQYWQQRADYVIRATLDTVAHTISGRETLRYTNSSPDALGYLWMFVEQNICSPNSVTEKLDQPPLVFLGSTFDFSQPFSIGSITAHAASASSPRMNRVWSPVIASKMSRS